MNALISSKVTFANKVFEKKLKVVILTPKIHVKFLKCESEKIFLQNPCKTLIKSIVTVAPPLDFCNKKTKI